MGNSAKRDTRALQTAANRLRMIELRKTGLSIREIASEMNCSVGGVHSGIATAIALANETLASAADEYRRLDAEGIAEDLERTEYDLGRLDARLEMLDQAMGVVGDAPGEGGTAEEVVMHELGLSEATSKVLTQLVGKKADLIAQRTALRARRAKMFGVDAAEKVEQTTVTTQATPAEAARLMQEMFRGNVGPTVTEPGKDDPGPQGGATA